tara:strand:+ start:2443 stop:2565 length:123 start_codon:yes stop_codon:yes gene_type:complete
MKMMKRLWSRIKAFFLRKYKKQGYLQNSFIVGYSNINDDK